MKWLRLPPGAVLLALLATGPALWAAFRDGTVSPTAAVQHFLLTAVIAGAGWTFVRGLVHEYQRVNEQTSRQVEAEDVVERALDATAHRPGT